LEKAKFTTICSDYYASSTKKSGFITNNSIVKGIVNLPKIERRGR